MASVGIINWAQNLALPRHFFHLCACTKPGKWAVMYWGVWDIDFYDFDI